MSAIAVRGIDNVLFTVGDLDAAVNFYAAKLGLPLTFRLDQAGIALFRLGDGQPDCSSAAARYPVREKAAHAYGLRSPTPAAPRPFSLSRA